MCGHSKARSSIRINESDQLATKVIRMKALPATVSSEHTFTKGTYLVVRRGIMAERRTNDK